MTLHHASATIPDFVTTKLFKLPPLPDENISLTSTGAGEAMPIDHAAYVAGSRTNWAKYNLTWVSDEWVGGKFSTKIRLITEDSKKWSEWSKLYGISAIQWYEIFYREDDGVSEWLSVGLVSEQQSLDFDFSYAEDSKVYLAIATGLSPGQTVTTDKSSIEYDGVGEYPNSHTLFKLGPLEVAA